MVGVGLVFFVVVEVLMCCIVFMNWLILLLGSIKVCV